MHRLNPALLLVSLFPLALSHGQTGGVAIDRIQMVQVIQSSNADPASEVPIIAGKPAIVRVFLRSTGTARVSAGIDGTLVAPGVDIVALKPRNAAAVFAAPGTPDSDAENASLNFVLPLSWTASAGNLTLAATVSVNGTAVATAQRTFAILPLRAGAVYQFRYCAPDCVADSTIAAATDLAARIQFAPNPLLRFLPDVSTDPQTGANDLTLRSLLSGISTLTSLFGWQRAPVVASGLVDVDPDTNRRTLAAFGSGDCASTGGFGFDPWTKRFYPSTSPSLKSSSDGWVCLPSFLPPIDTIPTLAPPRGARLAITGSVDPDQPALGPGYVPNEPEILPNSDPNGSACLVYTAPSNPDAFCFTPTAPQFAVIAPMPAGTTQLSLTSAGMTLATLTAPSGPPTVTLLAPNAGDVLPGPINMSWSALDPDNSPLVYAIRYSSNGGKTWLAVATGLSVTSYTLDTSVLDGGPGAMIQVLASSGFLTGVATSGAFTLQQPPTIGVPTTPQDFGSVPLGDTGELALPVTNSGNGPLNITAIVSSNPNFQLLGPTLPVMIPGIRADGTSGNGTSVNFVLRYHPRAPGSETTVFTFASNDPANPNATLSATGTSPVPPTPAISLPSAPIVFPDTTIGQSSTMPLAVSNSGNADLVVSAISVSAGLPFAAIPTSFTVHPGETQTVTVIFAPTASGIAAATLSIGSNDARLPNAVVTLAGTGVTPKMPRISLSATSLAFGTVVVGQSQSQPFDISNNGTAPLNIKSLTTPAGFTATPSAPFAIAPGASTTVTVKFSPATGGALSGTLTIASDDPQTPSASVSLSGTGDTGAPKFSSSASTLSFESTLVGQVAAKSFSLANSGNAAGTITSITVAAPFSVTTSPTLPATIQPSSALSIAVTFAPTSGGPASGALTINVANQPSISIPLTGTGDPGMPRVDTSVAALAFDATPVGATVTKSITLTNTGNVQATVSSVSAVAPYAVSATSPALPAKLQPNGTLNITVSFTPSVIGPAAAGSLNIGLSNLPSISIPLSGSGVDPSCKANSGGSISGTSNAIASSYDLTNEGSVDWVFAGSHRNDRKNVPSPAITAPNLYTPPGAKPNQGSANDQLRVLTWSDGFPDPSGQDNGAAFVEGGGFTFSLPADTTQRTVYLHIAQAGGNKKGYTLTGHLLDCSGADFVDTVAPEAQLQTRNYTITYHAATETNLVFTLTDVDPATGDRVYFSGAALSNGMPGAGKPNLPQIAAVDFGGVPAGTSKTVPVTFTNTGTGPAMIASFSTSKNSFSAAPQPGVSLPYTLAPNSTFTAYVTFTGFSPGAQSATFSINGSNFNSLVVNVSANAVPPSQQIAVTPATADIGNVAIGKLGSTPLTISNAATMSTLTVSSAKVSGPFVLSSLPLPILLPPGFSAQLLVTLTPTSPGPQTGALTIVSDDPLRPSISIGIRATGVPASCSFTIDQTNFSVPVSTTSTTLNIKASAATCPWQATSNASWLVFTSTPNGIGSASLTFTTNVNSLASARTATLSIGGVTVLVTQEPAFKDFPMVETPMKTDGGTFTKGIGYPGGRTGATFVNRLTPPKYPAVLENIQLYFTARPDGLALNTPITLLVATNTGGTAAIGTPTFRQIPGYVNALGAFSTYNMPAISINSGDFLVGFMVDNAKGISPADVDISSPSMMLSYSAAGSDPLAVIDGTALNAGNLAIRATVLVAK